jgi:exonuclease III
MSSESPPPSYASIHYSQKQEHSYLWEISQIPRANSFTTHRIENHGIAKKIYSLAHALLIPWQTFLQVVARIKEPSPGEYKDRKCRAALIRIGAYIATPCLFPIAMISLIVGGALHLAMHVKRPYISYIGPNEQMNKEQCAKRDLSAPHQLQILTYNIGLVPEALATATNLRPICDRAREIVTWVCDKRQTADVICFQETFHVGGTRILANGIQKKYPYIIHSVAPHGSGFSSGLMIASKYPLERVSFLRFNGIAEEALATKGLLGVRVLLGATHYANIYNIHTQALLGKKVMGVRRDQILHAQREILAIHERDLLSPSPRQKMGDFLCGDFNASSRTAWNQENQGEVSVPALLNSFSYTASQKDHGTWWDGIIPKIPSFIKSRLARDGIPLGKENNPQATQPRWGTRAWADNDQLRTVTQALFDYHFAAHLSEGSNGSSRILQIIPPNKESASSDHLPVLAAYQLL